MQVKTTNPATATCSYHQQLNASSLSSDLQDFCQLQAENLINRYPIFGVRIVYYDSHKLVHQEVVICAQTHSLSQNSLAYLSSERWLIDFPAAFTLTELSLNIFAPNCYICPFGYRNLKPEYILIFACEPLSATLQQSVIQAAMLLSKYLDIYLEYGRQKAEIQLLEQTLQRAGHQLRNPLILINLYAENLYLSLPNNSWQEQANIIRETVQYLDTNLNELICCGQSKRLKATLQDLRTLVVESIQGLQPLLEQKQLQICYPDTSTTLMVDRLQMKQVFDNLLSNAIHFSPDFGTITCSWQVFQGEVLIRITDQGPGLSSEDIQHIFTPFYSRRPGGTGLGLTIAQKIVLDHQGSLWAQNLFEGGAQFSMSLPRHITL